MRTCSARSVAEKTKSSTRRPSRPSACARTPANDGSTYSVPGGIGDIAFPAAHQNSVPCGSLVQIDGGKYVSKVPLTCFKNVPLSVLAGK